MKQSERKELYRQALAKWNIMSQLDMAVEESFELIKAICKFKRLKDDERGVNEVHAIVEEIADMKIMLEQLEQIFHCEHKVKSVIRNKLLRLKGIVNEKPK